MPFKVKKLTPIKTDSLPDLGASVLDLAKYVEDEFGEVSRTLQGTEAVRIWTVAPPKPRQGTIVYADGVHWNPGAGEGFYEYTSSSPPWIPLFVTTASLGTVPASASQFGAVKVDGTTITASGGVISAANQIPAAWLTAWTAYTPTITCTAGVYGATSASGRYKQIGKTCFLDISVTLTTIGTATGYPLFTLPFTSGSTLTQILHGRETQVTGNMQAAQINAGGTTGQIIQYNNTAPVTAGMILVCSGTYETT